MNTGNELHARLRALLTEMSRRDNGVGSHDVSGYTVAYVGQTASVMVRRGQLHRGKTAHHNVRFFSTAEAARAWERSEFATASNVARNASASVTHAPPGGRGKHQRAWWPADAQPVFTADTVYTYGASPGQAYRTNTHQED